MFCVWGLGFTLRSSPLKDRTVLEMKSQELVNVLCLGCRV